MADLKKKFLKKRICFRLKQLFSQFCFFRLRGFDFVMAEFNKMCTFLKSSCDVLFLNNNFHGLLTDILSSDI